jgi:hypothetical protein
MHHSMKSGASFSTCNGNLSWMMRVATVRRIRVEAREARIPTGPVVRPFQGRDTICTNALSDSRGQVQARRARTDSKRDVTLLTERDPRIDRAGVRRQRHTFESAISSPVPHCVDLLLRLGEDVRVVCGPLHRSAKLPAHGSACNLSTVPAHFHFPCEGALPPSSSALREATRGRRCARGRSRDAAFPAPRRHRWAS